MFAAAALYLSRDSVEASDDMIPGVIQDCRSYKKPIYFQEVFFLNFFTDLKKRNCPLPG